MIWMLDTDTVNYVLKHVRPVLDRHARSVRDGDEFLLSSVVHSKRPATCAWSGLRG